MNTRDKITKIIYQNSTDTSDSLCIRFGKVQKMIDEIEALISPVVVKSLTENKEKKLFSDAYIKDLEKYFGGEPSDS